MKNTLLWLLLVLPGVSATAQDKKINPVIPNYGGIYAIPEATVTPDPRLQYKIVVDAKTGSDDPGKLAFALYNAARMLNLHAAGGVPPENLQVVLAIHGKATYAVLENKSYRKIYGTGNPNLGLIKELKAAGVQLVVCGQSLKGRNIQPDSVVEEVEIATSMLTTVSTYQLKGFALFVF